MKYMIFMYGSQQDYDALAGKPTEQGEWTPEQLMAMQEFMGSYNKKLADSGELVDTRALTAPVHTRRIHAQDGVQVVMEGPYPEDQRVLAGYWIVECPSFDRATEIALGLTACPGPEWVGQTAVVDVRPIAEYGDDLG